MTARVAIAVAVVGVLATSCVSLPEIEVDQPTPAGSARAGGTLKVGLLQPRALDPADASDDSSRLVAATMCDTLLQVDPATGALEPGIAQKWAVSTETGVTRILASLRKDVYFPDGRQVDAKAVVGSLSRLAREETAGSMAGLLRDVDGYEDIRGQTEDPPDRSRELLSGVRVSDPFGIEIVVTGEDAGWIRRLADPATAIVDDAAGRRDPLEFARLPVCAGPYRSAAPWNPGDPILRLVRNEKYHGSPSAMTRNGAGYAKEILFYFFDAPELPYTAYTEGRVDVAPVPVAERPKAAKEQPKSYLDGNGEQVVYVGLPWQSGNLFEDESVRIALSQAVDRRALARGPYAGSVAPAGGFLPPVVGPAYRPRACAAQVPERANVAAARASVAATRARLRGQSAPLYFYEGYQNPAVAAAVAASWQAAFGLKVALKPLKEEDFLARAAAGFDGPFLMGWDGAGLNLATGYLRMLVGSGEDGNVAKFSDPVLDRYFAKESGPAGGRAGTGLGTESEQLVALGRAESRVCALMPVVPLVFVHSHWMVRAERVSSARSFRLTRQGTPALRELWVKPVPPTKSPSPVAQ